MKAQKNSHALYLGLCGAPRLTHQLLASLETIEDRARADIASYSATLGTPLEIRLPDKRKKIRI
jgi:hypothetical protein